ncbi:hypothetical protein FUT88_13295 [Ralstonia sp. TCR112]|uniref:hypothetical protein n=1 Tax=Ralstonia sp. TCR112 TaxID=2601730 RepID=UPI0011BF69BC|nr:hypothetical protein [Ralstonia sp. TCR112]TXD58850.1 hypothetical protein FUT88_13295 [Ralstonia sp. TCR112]
MLKKLMEIVTDDTNVTLEPAYALGAAAFVVGIGLEIYAVIAGKTFDLQAYGVGVGVLIASVGASKKLGS